jgi:membrane protein
MEKKSSRLKRIRERARALLGEPQLQGQSKSSRMHRFVHFWVLVWRSFVRNRCPVRASALAYGTLLALIPMLAVVMSISSGLLKKEGEAGIEKFIEKFVANVSGAGSESAAMPVPAETDLKKDGEATATPGHQEQIAKTQKTVARSINEFIQNTRSGALGVTGSVLLIFAAISMLSRIEATFNDIWGVARGRSWFMRVVLYWGVLSLAPILLVVALGLASGPHLESTKRLLATLPFVGNFIINFGFQIGPVAVLCLGFGAFYMLMPNTRVEWRAALVGGLMAGLLFHLNNMVSVLYVSRVVSNSKIYGSLGLVPVFMIGLYLSWLILLFGAQVAYAFQNRSTYLEEKQVENINQRGREFIALRIMTRVGQRYLQGAPPLCATELAEELSVPTRLVRQIMQTLTAARLVVETAGAEPAYLPARPMERITCHDMLHAMRATQGQELATRDEPSRAEVYGEFQRIQEAERQVASGVTMLALANRAQAHAQLTE